MRHNSKSAYGLLKDLTTDRKGRINTIQDNKGKNLIEEDATMSRWTEYCTELYNHPVREDTAVLNCINENKEPHLTILRHDIETAVNSLEISKLTTFQQN